MADESNDFPLLPSVDSTPTPSQMERFAEAWDDWHEREYGRRYSQPERTEVIEFPFDKLQWYSRNTAHILHWL